MTIATCPRCLSTGSVDGWYCDCPAATALRARVDVDPRIAETRARVDRLLAGQPEPAGIPPSYGWMRPVAVPHDAPESVKDLVRSYNALVDPASNPEVN